MSARSSEAALLSAALLAISACTCGGPQGLSDAGPDAGRDAGRRDAGRDAGRRDAGPDAGRDGGAVDSGPPSGWVHIPGTPEECPIEIAEDPARSRPPLRFEPCPEAPDRCRKVVIDWDPGPAPNYIGMSHVGRHDGRYGYFGFLYRDDDDVAHAFVARDDGQIVLALRSPRARETSCYIGTVDAIETHYALVLSRPDPAADGHVIDYVGGGRLDDVADSFRVLHTLSTARMGIDAQYVRVSNAGIAVDTYPNQIHWVPWEGAVSVVATDVTDGWQPTVQEVIGDVTFYDVLSVRNLVRVSEGGAPGIDLIDPSEGEAFAFHTDGRDMTWLQGYGRRDVNLFDRVELWSAPFASRPPVTGRRIATLSSTGTSTQERVGFGYAAGFRVGDGGRGDKAVYRIADGRQAIIPSLESGVLGWQVQYVGPTEIAMTATGRRRNLENEHEPTRFYRIDGLVFE